MAIHEAGDESLRPTDKAWKCPKCGTELLTVSCILSHKERCTDNPNVKTPEPQKTRYETEREKLINENMKQFKNEHGVR